MTTSPALPRDPDAPPQTSGSAAGAEELRCKYCERPFKAKIALWNHEKSHEREAQEPLGEPKIEARKAPKLGHKELAQLQADTAENIRTVGGLLHAGLVALKLARLQSPDLRLRIPRTKIDLPLPAVDTHLPFTLLARSEITARVLVEHAAENETLLRWVVRFNGWFKGGEVGQLVAEHVAATAFTAGLQGPLLETAAGAVGLGDVLQAVEEENGKLRLRVQQLQADLARGQAARPAGDERGAGG